MRTLLSLLFAFSMLWASAQGLDVSEDHGEPFKTKATYILDIHELEDGGYWSITKKYQTAGLMLFGMIKAQPTFYMQRYDEDMKLVQQERLITKVGDKKLELEKIIEFQGEFYAFLTFDNKQRMKTYLFYTKINVDDLQFEGTPEKIAEIKLGNKSNNMRPGSFTISVSDNDKYLVVFGKKPRRIQKVKLFGNKTTTNDGVGTHTFDFTFWVFNSDFAEVNHEENYELSIENSSNTFYVRSYSVDDKGAIYIVGKNSIVDRYSARQRRQMDIDRWVDVKQSAFIIEKINPDGTSYQQITPEDKLFVDMDILFDNNGDVSLVGLTADEEFPSLTTGVYRMVLDSDNLDVMSEAADGFSEEVLDGVNNTRESEELATRTKRGRKRMNRRKNRMSDEEKAYRDARKRAAENVNHINIAEIDEDGNVYLVLEEFYIREVTTTTTDANGNTTTTTTYYYNYDDLIMVKFQGEEVHQNFYEKHFVIVNRSLQKSLDATVVDGELKIMTYSHIVSADEDLGEVKSHELKSFDRKDKVPGMRRKYFNYRKTVNDHTIMAAAQFKNRILWYRVTVN